MPSKYNVYKSSLKSASAPLTDVCSTLHKKNFFNADFLSSKTPAQLLLSLVELSNFFEGVSNPSSLLECNSSQFNGNAKEKGSLKSLFRFLAQPSNISSPLPDIRVMTACCLSALITETSDATDMPDFQSWNILEGISQGVLANIISLFASVLATAQTEDGKKNYYSYIRKLIERLSNNNVMHCVLSAAAKANRGQVEKLASAVLCSKEIEDGLNKMFEALILLDVDGDESLNLQLCSILNDILNECGRLSEKQLTELISVLKRKSKKSNLASIFIRSNASILCEDIVAHVSSQVKSSIDTFITALTVSGAELEAGRVTHNAVSLRRKLLLGKVCVAFDVFVLIASLSELIASALVSEFTQYLSFDPAGREGAVGGDVRIAAVHGFSAIFLQNPDLFADAFPGALTVLLSRFGDQRAAVRIRMLDFARTALTRNPVARDGQWALFEKHLAAKLQDSDDSVRVQAVNVTADILETNFFSGDEFPRSVVKELSLRCQDKQVRVRSVAIARLVELYNLRHATWIPSAIMSAAFVTINSNVLLVETALSDLALNALAREGRISPRTSQLDCSGTRIGSASGASAVPPAILVFAQFCSCLDNPSWEVVLALMQKKEHLRLTMRRFIEVRRALKAKQDVENNVSIAKRLSQFVSEITHAKSDEVMLLMVEKDETTTKCLYDMCSHDNTDFFTAGEIQLLTKANGRASRKVYSFIKDNLTRRLYLPFSSADVSILVKWLSEQFLDAKRHGEEKVDETTQLGVARALQCLFAMAPQLVGNGIQFIDSLSDIICRTFFNFLSLKENESHSEAQIIKEKQTLFLLHIFITTISQAAVYFRKLIYLTPDGTAFSSQESEKNFVSSLGRIALGIPELSDDAAMCLVNFFAHTDISHTRLSVFKQLTSQMFRHLEGLIVSLKKAAVEEGNDAFYDGLLISPVFVACAKTFSVLSECCSDAISADANKIVTLLGECLTFALRAHGGVHGEDVVARSSRSSQLSITLDVPCPSAETLNACAHALVEHTLALSPALRGEAIRDLFILLASYVRDTQTVLNTKSLGAILKRYFLVNQLLRLFVLGGVFLVENDKFENLNELTAAQQDLFKTELMLVSIISSDSNDDTRHSLQQNLKQLIIRSLGNAPVQRIGTVSNSISKAAPSCDARHLAMLVASALSETTKNGFTQLRHDVNEVMTKMRHFQTSAGVSGLEDPRATCCFPEYAIPSLVFYLAHHPFYTTERHPAEPSALFFDFSRPWQLLLSELLRANPHSAIIAQSMLRKLSAMDDQLAASATEPAATRIIATLGLKIFESVLVAQRVQLGLFSSGAFTIMFPRCFKKSTKNGMNMKKVLSEVFPHGFEIPADPIFSLRTSGMPPPLTTSNSKNERSIPSSLTSESENDVEDEDKAPSLPEARKRPRQSADSFPSDTLEKTLSATTTPRPSGGIPGTPAGASPLQVRLQSSISASRSPDQRLPSGIKAALARRINAAVRDLAKKMTLEELKTLRFKEVKIAVSHVLCRDWNESEKEYAKLCLVEILKEMSTEI